jgi:NAD(P)-dependent dehydrogenase (short-subunit alcohol dehydrogenase family)
MKTALILGAGGGIGKAITARLAQENWQVLAAGRHMDVIEEFTPYTYDCDFSDEFSLQSAMVEISQEASQVDLWVYAAGDIVSCWIKELRPAEWQRILQANLIGAYLATHFSLPILAEDAHLFYLGAVSERMQLPGLSAYAAAKAGLEAFAEVVRKESRRKVTVVRPGAVDTPFWGKIPFKLPPHPLTPEDVAARILQAYSEGIQGKFDL